MIPDYKHLVASVLTAGLVAIASAALAGPPAAIAPSDPGRARAESSFHTFAKTWMKKLDGDEAHNRRHAHGSYIGYGNDYRVELRPTGNARAPYVGLLHYREQTFHCAGRTACKVAGSQPVTEIFRYQNGRWIY